MQKNKGNTQSKSDVEKALLLKIRFATIMAVRKMNTHTLARLDKHLEALNEQLNLIGPSQWFLKTFFSPNTVYSDIHYSIQNHGGKYRVTVEGCNFEFNNEKAAA